MFSEEIDLDKIERAVTSHRRRKLKDEELVKVVEEVFDYRTLMVLYKMFSRNILKTLYGVVAAGKEARVYWGVTPRGEDVAVKIYLVSTAEFRKSRLKYMMGDPRFKRIGRNIRDIVELWSRKEYRNMLRAYRAGVSTPKPYAVYGNVLVMEFVDAGRRGVPAPRLKDVYPENAEELFLQVRDEIRKAVVEAEIVHADLSEYNILYKEGKAVIIDWGSGVHVDHPHAKEFLLRDLERIHRYFAGLGVNTGDYRAFYRELVKEIRG